MEYLRTEAYDSSDGLIKKKFQVDLIIVYLFFKFSMRRR